MFCNVIVFVILSSWQRKVLYVCNCIVILFMYNVLTFTGVKKKYTTETKFLNAYAM